MSDETITYITSLEESIFQMFVVGGLVVILLGSLTIYNFFVVRENNFLLKENKASIQQSYDLQLQNQKL